MPSSMELTSPVMIEADRALGVALELFLEYVERLLPPFKHYRTVCGLEDLGPIIPEWCGPMAAAASAKATKATAAPATTTDKRVHPTIVVEALPGIAA